MVASLGATLGTGARAADCPLADPAPASVFLVQDSGWMEPFYADPASPFRPLVSALVGAAAPGGGDVVVAGFDQDGQVPGRASPDVRWCGRYDPAAVRGAVAALDLPRQPDGAYADADLDGALVNTIGRVLRGHAGIVWIITNNENSPGNSQDVARNTRDFAARLSNTAALPAVVAYPLRLAVRGRDFAGSGLIVYGIAYGAEAAARLRAVTDSAAMRALFPGPAARLKPLDTEPVRFVPTGTPADGVRVAAVPGGGLLVSGLAGGRTDRVELSGRFVSDYYPQVIERAAVSVGWRGEGGVAASVTPSSLSGLAPGGERNGVRIRLDVPAVPRGGGAAGLLRGDAALRGALVVRLSDMTLGLDPGFTAKMAAVTALDQLPGVFLDYRQVRTAETVIPVTLTVRFSAAPLAALLAGAGIGLAGLAGLALLLRRAREQIAVVAGERRRLRLRPFERRVVAAGDGTRWSVRGALFGSPRVTILEDAGNASRPVPPRH